MTRTSTALSSPAPDSLHEAKTGPSQAENPEPNNPNPIPLVAQASTKFKKAIATIRASNMWQQGVAQVCVAAAVFLMSLLLTVVGIASQRSASTTQARVTQQLKDVRKGKDPMSTGLGARRSAVFDYLDAAKELITVLKNASVIADSRVALDHQRGVALFDKNTQAYNQLVQELNSLESQLDALMQQAQVLAARISAARSTISAKDPKKGTAGLPDSNQPNLAPPQDSADSGDDPNAYPDVSGGDGAAAPVPPWQSPTTTRAGQPSQSPSQNDSSSLRPDEDVLSD